MPQFDHEKLKVYQAAIRFVAWSTELLAQIPSKAAVKDQLDRASTSVPLNIAEGNGKFAIRDRCRFLDFARGSALECAACLDVVVAKRLLSEGTTQIGKTQLLEIVSMLMGLISSLSTRIQEDDSSLLALEQE
jgi:four helix bundle protein